MVSKEPKGISVEVGSICGTSEETFNINIYCVSLVIYEYILRKRILIFNPLNSV